MSNWIGKKSAPAGWPTRRGINDFERGRESFIQYDERRRKNVPGYLEEISQIFHDSRFRILSPADRPEPQEDLEGQTLNGG
jgi:hypothetical protein